MVWFLAGLPVFALMFGLALAWWLRSHPGHPILEELDKMALEEAKQVKLFKVATMLQRLGIVPSVTLPGMTPTTPAPAPPAPPPPTTAK